jgi:hypothetical protein
VSLLGLEPDAEQEYRQRLVVEARAAGRLSQPRIVTIFDVAEDPNSQKTVLWIDDQPLPLLTRKILLVHAGYAVLTAEAPLAGR